MPRGASSSFVGVSFGLILYQACSSLPVGADEERRAHDAHVHLAVHLLLLPHAVRLGDGVVDVGQQREAEAVLGVELRLRRRLVGADADDRRVADLAEHVAEAARLRRAARRVGPGIEVHERPPPLERRRRRAAPVLVGQGDVGGGITGSEHRREPDRPPPGAAEHRDRRSRPWAGVGVVVVGDVAHVVVDVVLEVEVRRRRPSASRSWSTRLHVVGRCGVVVLPHDHRHRSRSRTRRSSTSSSSWNHGVMRAASHRSHVAGSRHARIAASCAATGSVDGAADLGDVGRRPRRGRRRASDAPPTRPGSRRRRPCTASRGLLGVGHADADRAPAGR